MLTISQDAIYFKLKQQFEASFVHRSDHPIQVGSARFFSKSEEDFGHVVLVPPDSVDSFAQWARPNLMTAARLGRRLEEAAAKDAATRMQMESDSGAIPDMGTIDAAFSTVSGTLFVVLGVHDNLHIPMESGVSTIALETRDVAEVFNALATIYQQFSDWRDNLIASIGTEDEFKRIIDTCDSILGEPLSIVDDEFVYVAYSDSSIQEGLVESSDGVDVGVPEYILQEYYSSPDFKHITERHEVFLQSFTFGDSALKNLFCEDRYIGRMGMRLVPYNEENFRFYAAMLNCIAPVVEYAYGMHRSFSTTDEPLAGTRQIIARCLAGQTVTQQELETSQALLGWARGDELQLVQLLPNLRYDNNPYPRRTIPFIEERWRGCIGFENQSKLFVLVNLDCFHADQGEGFDQALSYLVRDDLMTAGLSNSFYNLANLHEAFIQTEVALSVGSTDRSLKWTFRFDECAVRFLVSNSTGPYSDDTLALVSKKVRRLVDHDAEKGTDYYHTLEEYLRCHMNASATARALFIHRSSFLSRMERINALVDLHLESPDEVLYLAWSFQMMNSLQ